MIEIVAIIIGPLLAVGITLWYQDRQRDYERKLSVLEGLVLWRNDFNREEWVKAFNLVPVYFRKHEKVITKRKALYTHFIGHDWDALSPEAYDRLMRQVPPMNVELIQAVGTVIKVNMPDLSLMEAAIAPGANHQEVETTQLRRAAIALLSGESILNVVAWPPPPPADGDDKR